MYTLVFQIPPQEVSVLEFFGPQHLFFSFMGEAKTCIGSNTLLHQFQHPNVHFSHHLLNQPKYIIQEKNKSMSKLYNSSTLQHTPASFFF